MDEILAYGLFANFRAGFQLRITVAEADIYALVIRDGREIASFLVDFSLASKQFMIDEEHEDFAENVAAVDKDIYEAVVRFLAQTTNQDYLRCL